MIDVVDFADAKDRDTPLSEHIHQHGLRRLDRVIMPAFRSAVIPRRPGEGPGDDAANTVRAIEQLPSDLAHTIQLGDRDHILVRGDLKYAVAGGINDGIAGASVLVAEFLENLSSGCRFIAKSSAANLTLEFCNYIWRKTVGINGESLVEPDSGHFPVACRRVLSGRARCALAEVSERASGRREICQRLDIG